jgi:hypothetical protein
MKPGLVIGSLLLLAGTNLGLAQPAGSTASPSAFINRVGSPAPANTESPPPPQPTPLPPAGDFSSTATPGAPALVFPDTQEQAPFLPQMTTPRRGWFDADYLLWWLKPAPNNNIFITTGSPTDPVPGALGAGGPNSEILFGGSPANSSALSGLRLSTGVWIDADQTFAIEGRGFFLQPDNSSSSAAGNATGNPVVAIPFHDVNLATRSESAALVSNNLVQTGSADLVANDKLWGAEGNVLYTLCPGFASNVRLLAGYRYVNLHEDLSLQQNLVPISNVFFDGAAVRPPNTVGVVDSFTTRNQFNGGQIGFQGNVVRGCCFASLTGKVAFGATHEDIDISGFSSLLQPGQPPVTVPGGLFAQRTNIGHYSANRFAVVPEGELRVGFRFCRYLTASLGYTFFYWSNVARPGDQVDRNINSSQVPTSPNFGALNGPSAPSPFLRTSDFWAQGLSFSLGVLY